MMKTSIHHGLLAAGTLVVFLAGAVPAAARGPQSPYVHSVLELVLRDGSRAYGVVVAEDATDIVFRTSSGAELKTPRARIASLRPVTGRMVGGEFRREDPNNTRLAFGPTARAVPRGQAYLAVFQGIVPFVQVGVTDRFSIGGGTPLVFAFDDWDRPFWVSPKLQVYSGDTASAAVGVFHAFAGDDSLGVAYGVYTREQPRGAFTLGAGLGYSDDGVAGAVVMVGGEAPVRRNIKWITENYAFRSTVITSGGFRFFGERLSADLVIAIAFTDESVFAFPVVNFVYRF